MGTTFKAATRNLDCVIETMNYEDHKLSTADIDKLHFAGHEVAGALLGVKYVLSYVIEGQCHVQPMELIKGAIKEAKLRCHNDARQIYISEKKSLSDLDDGILLWFSHKDCSTFIMHDWSRMYYTK